jgi:hypothetical protein
LYSEAWRDAFRENKSLIHVDISHNNVPKVDMEIIAEGLKDNHTIMGIHVAGNAAYVDNQGFVIPSEELSKAESMITSKIKSDLKSATIKDPHRI